MIKHAKIHLTRLALSATQFVGIETLFQPLNNMAQPLDGMGEPRACRLRSRFAVIAQRTSQHVHWSGPCRPRWSG